MPSVRLRRRTPTDRAVARLAIEPFRIVKRREPWRLVRTRRFVLAMGTAPEMTIVDGVRAKTRVAETVRDVRAHAREHGRRSVIWMVNGYSAPGDLYDRLVELGLEPADRPPFEGESAAMVLRSPPAADAPSDIASRAVRSVAEARRGFEVLARCSGILEAALDEWVTPLTAGYDGRSQILFVAEADGEIVAAAGATPTRYGLWLNGAGVLPHARGRGAYRALIEARWKEALERGTPALTVQAGPMSEPVLARVGFHTIDRIRMLRDAL